MIVVIKWFRDLIQWKIIFNNRFLPFSQVFIVDKVYSY